MSNLVVASSHQDVRADMEDDGKWLLKGFSVVLDNFDSGSAACHLSTIMSQGQTVCRLFSIDVASSENFSSQDNCTQKLLK